MRGIFDLDLDTAVFVPLLFYTLSAASLLFHAVSLSRSPPVCAMNERSTQKRRNMEWNTHAHTLEVKSFKLSTRWIYSYCGIVWYCHVQWEIWAPARAYSRVHGSKNRKKRIHFFWQRLDIQTDRKTDRRTWRDIEEEIARWENTEWAKGNEREIEFNFDLRKIVARKLHQQHRIYNGSFYFCASFI